MSAKDDMLAKKVWAVVGVSADKAKFGYRVWERLKKAGYTVYAVNPNLDEIDGERVYPSLIKLPEKPDVVNCVVPPAVTEQVIPVCAGEGIRFAWMQPGSDSRRAVQLARENGIQIVQGCVLAELRKRV